ncbi:hypothetical protein HU200_013644 [Digitaria exilis]|uniref:F-box domain-containing protein n=1 Tax=Digitaria exilis TaxID=1010633 RepID=A0A835FCX5_9POAL|nr:hypothetical protein HU200_013644 [Digitaria exilis]
MANGKLPADLLYEVLLRLPANELCRLRLACRSWRSLTSDPGFAKAHASRHPIVACIHDDDGHDLEVRFLDLSSNIVIKRIPLQYRSYNLSVQLDLVCVTPFSGKEQCSILNPATSEATAMTGGTHGFETGPCVLGYISSTGEYKVLRIHTYTTRNDGETTFHLKQACEVMTLGDGRGGGTWRARPCPPVLVSPQSGQSVVVSGVAYFLLSQLDINCDPTEFKPDTIACFDMATEEWRQETLPAYYKPNLIAELQPFLDSREFGWLPAGSSLMLLKVQLEFGSTTKTSHRSKKKTLNPKPETLVHNNSVFCINVLHTSAMTLLESSRHGRKKPSAPLADYGLLPADIMFDVLLRLPAKELCRLRVVCQAWSSITQSPLFAKAHSSRHPLVLGLRNRSEVQFIDLSGNTVKKLATGACDLISPLELSSQLDLVCVSEITGPTCVVVNSATGAVTVLPRDIGIEQDINMGATHWHTGIIGQVPSIGEYKVLRFYFYHHHHQKKKNSGAIQACDVMTLHNKNGRWRARSPPRALFISTTSRDRVVVDGVAYFLLEHGVEPDAVASFDMATEEWRPMTLQGPSYVLNGIVKIAFWDELYQMT